jgi:transcriptional regulator with XRE-family HTH domain
MTELAPIVVQVGARLREARLNARLTAREAAERIGLKAHGTLVQYESGKVTPPLERLAALADVYGVPLASLFVEHDALIPVVTLLERATPRQVALLVELLQRALEQGSDG